jgi:ABC-type sugar transport system permease subunit
VISGYRRAGSWSIGLMRRPWITVPSFEVYQRAFEGFEVAEASTISVILCVFLLIFSVLFIRFVPAGETESEVI